MAIDAELDVGDREVEGCLQVKVQGRVGVQRRWEVQVDVLMSGLVEFTDRHRPSGIQAELFSLLAKLFKVKEFRWALKFISALQNV